MVTIMRILGGILILGGGTFFLQGLDVLKGSVMTGDPFWAWVGLIMLIAGVALVGYTFVVRRR